MGREAKLPDSGIEREDKGDGLVVAGNEEREVERLDAGVRRRRGRGVKVGGRRGDVEAKLFSFFGLDRIDAPARERKRFSGKGGGWKGNPLLSKKDCTSYTNN